MGIIARQSIKGTIVTYAGVFVGFLTTFFVLTRFLTAEEIGLSRTLIDIATLFIGLAQLGTSSSIIRFFPYFKSGGDDRSSNGFFFWTILIPLLGFLLFTFLYWILQAPIQARFAQNSPLIINYYYAVLPLAFFMLYQTIFETNSNVLMRIVFPRAVRELFLRLFLLAVYLLYAFRIVSMDGFVALICGAYGLAALMNIIYLFAAGHISLRPDFHFVDRQLARKYLFYTLFQLTSSIATALAPILSSLFITSQMGLSSTGVFAIATYIAVMVSIPNRSLNAIANPQLAQTTKDGDIRGLSTLLKQVSCNSFLAGSFLLAAIWLNIDLIFHILPNGSTYAVANYVVLLLSLSQLLIATFNATLSVLNFSRFYYLSLLYSFVLTLSALFLNDWLVPIYGINGAALANLLSYTLYFVLLILTLAFCCHTHPFSVGHAKTLLLFVLMLGGGWALDRFCPSVNLWVASAIKTIILWGGAAVIALRWGISPEINQLLKDKLHR